MYIKSNFIDTNKFIKEFSDFSNVEFSFFFDYIPTLNELNINPINIFAHDEPNEYFGHHDWVMQNKENFSLILTWNQSILKLCDNSRLLIYGEPWIDSISDHCIYEKNEKIFEVSFIRGKKLQSSGHLLRHQIYNKQNEIFIPNKFFDETNLQTIEDTINGKIDTHKNSMYSVVIENTSHHNYFTEKITDCMLLKTIPIYWGCSNIEKFYNIDGIIKIESDDDAIEKINNLTPEFYNSKKEVIEENWNRALSYRCYPKRIHDILKDVFINNNLL